MDKRKTILSVILLLSVTFASMSPALVAGFSNWDDQIMVTQNAKITSLSLSSLNVMFTTFHERLYHPLVLVSYALEYHFFGLHPHVYHVTNLVLHLFNTFFVFWFIFMLCGNNSIALITALLFGIHPMHVESVLWIPERKDMLYSFFFLPSLMAYTYYLKTRRYGFHVISLILFILSLLSKSMAMTLPLVLILIDYLMQRKFDRKAVIDKLSFFALAIPFGLLTILGHYEPGVHGREFSFSLVRNSILACQNVVFYLIKLVLPFKLSCLYPMPDKIQNIPQVIFLLSPLILLVLAALMFYTGRSTRKVIFGGLFFLVTISPVVNFLPVGLAVPADRYTYICYIGFFYIFAEGFEWAYSRYNKQLLIIILAIMFAALSVLTFERSLVWKDPFSLWNDCIRSYKNVPTAYYNLAEEYFPHRWDFDQAIPLYSKAIEVDPTYAEAYVNIGLIYYYKRDYRQAIKNYNEAERYRPDLSEISLNRANSYRAMGFNDMAINEYSESLHLKETPEGFYNRGNVYLAQGKNALAISDYSKAIGLRPSYADAYNNRGNVYFNIGDYDNALSDYTSSIMIDPKGANAYYNRAMIYAKKRDYFNALRDILSAKSLGMPVNEKVIRQLEELSR